MIYIYIAILPFAVYGIDKALENLIRFCIKHKKNREIEKWRTDCHNRIINPARHYTDSSSERY